ncbi:MAG: HNH endonuclease [Planctomycetaceae bacterium]|nr:HNH endonuclease [Planctomycetaceae bacterium]
MKATVREESHDKCTYCESKISHISPGHIEHLIPKSKRRDLVVCWQNLGYVCEECNREKGDYHEPDEPLLNPFIDNPEDHLLFFGPMILQKDLGKGYRTIRKLKLSRPSLVERKKERIEYIQKLIVTWKSLPDSQTKQILKEEILGECRPDKEYSATIRNLLKQSLDWDIPAELPPKQLVQLQL